MIPKGLFTQIAVVIISVGIIFTYIQPAFDEIGETQDIISRYQTERGKVEEVNRELSRQISVLESVSGNDQRALLTYMPDDVDVVSVMRDIKYLTDQSGAIFVDILDEGLASTEDERNNRSTSFVTAQTESDDAAYARTITFNVEGSYQQIKQLFQLMEQNDYPLEAHAVRIDSTEGGFLGAEIQLRTYSHLEPVIVERQ